MKKLAAVSLISLVLAGCVNPAKASVQTDQLENHRFVLENVDGKAVKGGKTQPEIRFSAQPNISLINNIVVSGTMCNGFNGRGKLSGRRVDGQNAGNDAETLHRAAAK